jgi:hypothetical protein
MARNPGGNITAAVREALDSVVKPSVRNAILDRALRAARRAQIPTDTVELEAFVQGPLHTTLLASLGPQLGASVAGELERIVLAAKQASTPPGEKQKAQTVRPRRSITRSKLPSADRGTRSTMPSRQFPTQAPGVVSLPPGSAVPRDQRWAEKQRRGIAPTLPATARVVAVSGSPPLPGDHGSVPAGVAQPTSTDFPRGTAEVLGVIGTTSVQPTESARPTVLVLSTDTALLRFFQAWLDLRASVEAVMTSTTLLTKLFDPKRARTVIVLDGKNPSLRPLTLAALAEELPAGAKVLLWGVPTHLHARMRNVSTEVERWLVYAGHTTMYEVVAECAKVLG